jgi:hypothetical protein
MSSTPESVQLVAPRPDFVWSARRDEVAVVAGVGRLEDVVDDLRRAVLLSLAEDPRAVVCDLSGVLDGRDADAQLLLATMGEQVRDWPAVPLALSCPDPALRRRLRQQPMSELVLLRSTRAQALAAVGRIAARPQFDCNSLLTRRLAGSRGTSSAGPAWTGGLPRASQLPAWSSARW